MNDNVKLDIAIEIMSSKVAEAMDRGNRKEIDALLDEREQIYMGNWEVINKTLESYSNDVKGKGRYEVWIIMKVWKR